MDKKPERSLALARIETSLGIKAAYYFRIVPQSNQPVYIRAIAGLGHEIGYHYEDLSLAKGNIAGAYENYKDNLAYFSYILSGGDYLHARQSGKPLR